MASRLNSDSSNGLQLISDSSGEIQFQSSGTTICTINSSGLSMQSGTAPIPDALSTASGSAPSYSARAWVNFDGDTSPITIRGSGNVSSITDSGVGQYTVNFTTAMSDTNYTVVGICGDSANAGNVISLGSNSWNVNQTTSSTTIAGLNDSGTLQDKTFVNIAVFR